MLVKILAAPALKAGDFTTVENKSVILTPIANSTGLQFSWTPGIYLSSDKICNPVCTPAADIAYNLTVTDNKGCSSSDEILVKVLKQIQIPNVFTPNADGINDKWQIKNLATYPGCTVDIYNRYGQPVYHSIGYNEPWDGTSKGKAVPAATYYFIINPKNSLDPLSGFVDIVR
jgi:gliding motility-associated-like protein